MDTLTHAISGAILTRACIPTEHADILPRATMLGFAAAAFPDIDYVVFWIDPLIYLNLHQGWTHSLLLLPVWALFLTLVFRRFTYFKGLAFVTVFILSALAIGIHIVGDVVTNYGTQIFAPLSDRRVALNYVFVIDPYLTCILALGLIVSILRGSRSVAIGGILVSATYTGLLAILHGEADAEGQRYITQRGMQGTQVHSIPQPFSPLNWKVIVRRGDVYYQAYVRLLSGDALLLRYPEYWPFGRSIHAYRPVDLTRWKRYSHFARNTSDDAISREVWAHPDFAGFRRFAAYPALHLLEHAEGEICVWYTDLRFTLPYLPAPFRYGMCRAHGIADWRLYRLRLFPLGKREPL